MFSVIGIFLSGVLITIIEVPSLIKKRLYKETYIFFSLLLFGMVLCICQAFRIKLPNPIELITVIYRPISDFVLTLLK